MITLGVDLAAEAKGTAAARIDWGGGSGVVTDVVVPAVDTAILALAEGVERIGIDCPLGWPLAFIDFVTAHRDGRLLAPADSIDKRRAIVYRQTDLDCMRQGLRPLSVAADRIGHAALRCAGLLALLDEQDRSGAGRVVEAYPAGSLKMWGLQHQRYKNDPVVLAESLALLEHRVGLTFERTADRATCLSSDHAFDAVITSLTARAAALGQVRLAPPHHADAARVEGWIVLPSVGLASLRS